MLVLLLGVVVGVVIGYTAADTIDMLIDKVKGK